MMHSITYATADRFAAPVPAGITLDGPGPAAPQRRSRLERVMGPAKDLGISEDCLSLNVWTPGGEGLPVLVFLHGGGFLTGSGGLPWYDGGLLAERGDIVVVTVNYRLGAFGYLYVSDDFGPANLGLLDQVEALRWVHDNIAAYGGDPSRVTLAGQSAGALSILALLARPDARDLFQRAILQSLPAGVAPYSAERAAEIGQLFLDQLGQDPRRAPMEDVLDAQLAVMAKLPRSIVPPYQLVAAGGVPADLLAPVGKDLLIGTTRDEIWAFDETMPAGLTDSQFREGSLALAEGGYAYQFDWHPSGSPFGACHCIELPFVFGRLEAWAEAPMLAGGDPSEMEVLARAVQDGWSAFVREGSPNWPPYPLVKHLGTGHP